MARMHYSHPWPVAPGPGTPTPGSARTVAGAGLAAADLARPATAPREPVRKRSVTADASTQGGTKLAGAGTTAPASAHIPWPMAPRPLSSPVQPAPQRAQPQMPPPPPAPVPAPAPRPALASVSQKPAASRRTPVTGPRTSAPVRRSSSSVNKQGPDTRTRQIFARNVARAGEVASPHGGRRAAVVVALLLGSAVTAFGVAPLTVTDPTPPATRIVSEPLAPQGLA